MSIYPHLDDQLPPHEHRDVRQDQTLLLQIFLGLNQEYSQLTA